MPCTSFGSSSGVSLWYAADVDIEVDPLGAATQLSTTPTTWHPIPMTGEALNTNMEVSISEQITSNRSFSNALLSKGEVSGTIDFELQANDFLYDMLICAMQTNITTSFEGATDWLPMDLVRNGVHKHCFALLRRVTAGSGYDWYVYRGCQVSGVSFTVSPRAIVTGAVSLTGGRVDDIIEDADSVPGWSFLEEDYSPLMGGGDSLKKFIISTWSSSEWTPVDVTLQTLSLAFDNQLRHQHAVGNHTVYAVGVGSGRFRATFSGSAYYSNPALYRALLEDTSLRIEGRLLDADGSGFAFESLLAKVTSRDSPMAGGTDQDIMVDTEFQAFEDLACGTLQIIKYTGGVVVGNILLEGDGDLLLESNDLLLLQA